VSVVERFERAILDVALILAFGVGEVYDLSLVDQHVVVEFYQASALS